MVQMDSLPSDRTQGAREGGLRVASTAGWADGVGALFRPQEEQSGNCHQQHRFLSIQGGMRDFLFPFIEENTPRGQYFRKTTRRATPRSTPKMF